MHQYAMAVAPSASQAVLGDGEAHVGELRVVLEVLALNLLPHAASPLCRAAHAFFIFSTNVHRAPRRSISAIQAHPLNSFNLRSMWWPNASNGV